MEEVEDQQEVGYSTLVPRIHSLPGVVTEGYTSLFLEKELPNYVRALEFGSCDAGIISDDIAEDLFRPGEVRSFELWEYGRSQGTRGFVLPLDFKSCFAGGLGKWETTMQSARWRFKMARSVSWSDTQAAYGSLLIVMHPGNPGMFAVIPSTYLDVSRRPDLPFAKFTEIISPTVVNNPPSPYFIEPFIVPFHMLAGFLRKIFLRAANQDSTPVRNPYTDVVYEGYVPKLVPFAALCPVGHMLLSSQERIRWLYRGFKENNGDLNLVECDFAPWAGDFNLVRREAGQLITYFTFEHKNNYWKFSADGNSISLSGITKPGLMTPRGDVLFEPASKWEYIYLESEDMGGYRYVVCLPRDAVPSSWWGKTPEELGSPLVPKGLLQPYLHQIQSPKHTAREVERMVGHFQHPKKILNIQPSNNRSNFIAETDPTATWLEHLQSSGSSSLVDVLYLLLLGSCRRSRNGLIFRLPRLHPVSDLVFCPYAWGDQDCRNYDDGSHTLPKRYHDLGAVTVMLPLTVSSTLPLLPLPKFSVKYTHLAKIAKAFENTLLCVLPHPGRDWQGKHWLIMPSEELESPQTSKLVQDWQQKTLAYGKGNEKKGYEFTLLSGALPHQYQVSALETHSILMKFFSGSKTVLMHKIHANTDRHLRLKGDVDQAWVGWMRSRRAGQAMAGEVALGGDIGDEDYDEDDEL